jgi:H+-transporting ATPase
VPATAEHTDTKPDSKGKEKSDPQADAKNELKSLPMEEVEKKLNSTPDGLSQDEAKKRLARAE